jgi:hypothetical protein
LSTTIQIEGKITPTKTLYSLRKVTPLDTSSNKDLTSLSDEKTKRPPLTLSQATSGDGGVQLISKEIQTESSKPKGDSKAYQLQGTVTPPDAPPQGTNGSTGGLAADK